MFNPEDISAMTASISSLSTLDSEVDKFYKLLKEKEIEPKSLNDLERIIRFFDSTYEIITKNIKEDKSIPEPLKQTVIGRFTIDFFAKLAETYSLDFMSVPNYLGEHNQKRFLEAQKNLV
jgi:hypothetical protein